MMQLALSAMLFAAPAPVAGGSDSCVSPEEIFGQGTFAFDLSTATMGTEGQSESLCTAAGGSAIDHDVWFLWTAPGNGLVRMYTCDQTLVNTKIAVYLGAGCPTPGTALDCNDNACGAQSNVEWPAAAGVQYLIQIGTAPGLAGGSGTFELYLGGNASNNLALVGTATQSSTGWGGVASRAIDGNTDGIYNNNSCTHTTDQPNSWWEVDLGATLPMSRVLLYNRRDCCHDRLSNFRVSVFDGANEVFGQDFHVGTGFVPEGGVHQVLVPNWVAGDRVRVGINGTNNVGTGLLTLAEVEVISDTPATSFCFGDGTGLICPCGNLGVMGEGCMNSRGLGAVLNGNGSASVLADDLNFSAMGLIPSKAAVLFQGSIVPGAGTWVLFGDGLRCAGGMIQRLGTRMTDSAGAATWGPGLATMGGWATGHSRHFQVWYSDPAASPCGFGFNTTNGLQLTLVP